MGADAGFDMVPRLSESLVDKQSWDIFIRCIQQLYEDDPNVEMKPNYIVFKAGEHPRLPLEGHKFLRFSSKITGSIASTTGVEHYIDTVTSVAKAKFGSRVRYWNELYDRWGTYGWKEVNESIKTYDQDVFEAPSSIATVVAKIDVVQDLDISVFDIRKIPGKGRGLVARYDIAQGTQIICERLILTAGSMPFDQLQVKLVAELKALPKETQRQFLSLHNNSPGKLPFSNIFKTNALPCGSGSPVGGVFPTICLINHSCIANRHNNWNSEAEHETIYAVRPIKAGEEITIP